MHDVRTSVLSSQKTKRYLQFFNDKAKHARTPYMGPGGSLNSLALFLLLLLPNSPILQSALLAFFVDPPGHGRIDGHYFHAGCPTQKTKTRYNANVGAQKTNTDTMHENNDHLSGSGLVGHSEISRLVFHLQLFLAPTYFLFSCKIVL